jgi:hypothetical protein
MKLKFTIILFLITLFQTGCTSLTAVETTRVKAYDKYWMPWRVVSYNKDKLKIGDIIIVRLAMTPLENSGHAAVVLANGIIGEYPKVGRPYWEGTSVLWTYNKNHMIILRYKNFNDAFKKQFLINSKKLKHGVWFYTWNKQDQNLLYCSQYVWYLYYMTARDLGYKLDLDVMGGPFVLPYDMLGHKDFKVVYFPDEVPPDYFKKQTKKDKERLEGKR